MRYAALLRAVNVAGHQKVSMAALRTCCEDAGLTDVRTLLQSGNVVFESAGKRPDALESLLEKAVAKEFGFTTEFFVRSGKDLERIQAENPFPKMARDDPRRLLVLFLKDGVTAARVADLQKAIRDREQVRGKGREIYIAYPDGVGRSRLTMPLIEKKLGTRGTGRNWNTVGKLRTLLEAT
ncbi:MAG TPA: DUF1697 domain-containing protein [Candidatus Polarisedimenticolaceae bacterium]|nr:DUF1697 domain-containing protein [Candidatus Polarisedimenticolaceae bacterium]